METKGSLPPSTVSDATEAKGHTRDSVDDTLTEW